MGSEEVEDVQVMLNIGREDRNIRRLGESWLSNCLVIFWLPSLWLTPRCLSDLLVVNRFHDLLLETRTAYVSLLTRNFQLRIQWNN